MVRRFAGRKIGSHFTHLPVRRFAVRSSQITNTPSHPRGRFTTRVQQIVLGGKAVNHLKYDYTTRCLFLRVHGMPYYNFRYKSLNITKPKHEIYNIIKQKNTNKTSIEYLQKYCAEVDLSVG